MIDARQNRQKLLSRRTIFFVSVMIFLMSIGEGAVTPAIPLYGDALGASYSQLGFFMTGYSVAYMLMTVTSGAISDLIGRKRILLLSITLSVIASVGYCYAMTPAALLGFRTLEGMSRGILWPIAEAIVTGNAEAEARGKAMGRFGAAYGLGSVLGTLGGGFIMQNISVTAVFPLYPVIGLLVLGTSLYGITDQPSDHKVHHHLPGFAAIKGMVKEIKNIWPVCLSGFAYAGFFYSVWGLLPKIADHAGALPQQIGYLFALFWATRLSAFVVSGEAAQRTSHKKILIAGIGFIILSTLIFFVATSYWHLLLAAAASGIGTGVMFTMTITLIADLIKPAYLGFGMGFLEFSMGMGMVLQTTMSGIIGEKLGINYTYLLVFVAALVALVAALFYLRPVQQEDITPAKGE